MTIALDIAKRYFDLSNRRDLSGIAEMLSDSTTYSSQHTGVYLGRAEVMHMQRQFYARFKNMHWQVDSVSEVRPGVVMFDFVFTGETHAGETVTRPGLEYVIVYDGKLQHIEVRSKG